LSIKNSPHPSPTLAPPLAPPPAEHHLQAAENAPMSGSRQKTAPAFASTPPAGYHIARHRRTGAAGIEIIRESDFCAQKELS
jgi:hypothetical protein